MKTCAQTSEGEHGIREGLSMNQIIENGAFGQCPRCNRLVALRDVKFGELIYHHPAEELKRRICNDCKLTVEWREECTRVKQLARAYLEASTDLEKLPEYIALKDAL